MRLASSSQDGDRMSRGPHKLHVNGDRRPRVSKASVQSGHALIIYCKKKNEKKIYLCRWTYDLTDICKNRQLVIQWRAVDDHTDGW